MFWKKDKSPLFVELNTDNARQAYRVTPSPHAPITLLIDDKRCRILNISAVGVAFILEDSRNHLPETDQPLQATLILGDAGTPPIPVTVEIIHRQGDQLRARLAPLTDQAQKALCHYLVTQQKQAIRRQVGETEHPSAPAPKDSNERE